MSSNQWVPAARDYLQSNGSGVAPWTWENHRSAHPATISAMIAVSASPNQFGSSILSPQIIWGIVYALLAVLLFLHSIIVTNNAYASVLLVLAVMTSPLIENHVLIFGYAEIFLVLALVSGPLLLVHFREVKSTISIIFVSGVCLAALKNIGWMIWCIMVGAYVLAMIGENRSILLKILLIAAPFFLVAILYTFYSRGIELEFNLRFRDLLILQPENIFMIPRNELYSLFLNSSFGLVPLALVFAIIYFFYGDLKGREYYYLAIVSIGLIGFLVISQLSVYGFLFAIPERDTGNSRFTQLFILVGALMLPYLFRQQCSPVGTAIIAGDQSSWFGQSREVQGK